MPVYEYRCKECGETFEKKDNRGVKCCDKPARRLYSFSPKFKGSGFHVNDYGDKK